MSIKVILIDDHTLFRSGIKALPSRQSDLEVTDEAVGSLTGIKLIEQMHPDIVLLDLDISVMNGRETLTQTFDSNPQQAVVMLIVSEDNDDLTKCIHTGARGLLLKNIDADFLLDSTRKAVDGDNMFSPEMTTHLVQSLISPASSRAGHLLSTFIPREMEVLGYLVAGRNNKVIACHPELAESTVRVHVQDILHEPNLNSRV